MGGEMETLPPLKPLHSETSLSNAKLSKLDQVSDEEILRSLQPGNKDCLKAREDGTLLDGHHCIYILRQRGINVDTLPREIIPSATASEPSNS